MFVSFSTKLKKAGGFRLGVGKRLHGWSAVFVLLFVGLFYLMYWSLLACAWVMYGVLWLCWLPFSLIFKSKKKKSSSAAASPSPDSSTYHVFVAGSGKCYHTLPECSGCSNMKRVPLTQAKKMGLTACSRCKNADISAYTNKA